MHMGGIEYLGWGQDRQLAAHTYDSLNMNTLVSGSWKKGKEPKFKPWPRPGDNKKSAPKKKISLANLQQQMLSGKSGAL